MDNPSRIAFDRKGLWTMLGSFSTITGVGVYSFWNPAPFLGFLFRSVGFVRTFGMLLAVGGGWYVVRTLWMFRHRQGAIELGEISLVVRGAGPPVRRIAWTDVQGATASAHNVSIKLTSGKRITVPQILLEFPYGWGGERLAREIADYRRAMVDAGEDPAG